MFIRNIPIILYEYYGPLLLFWHDVCALIRIPLHTLGMLPTILRACRAAHCPAGALVNLSRIIPGSCACRTRQSVFLIVSPSALSFFSPPVFLFLFLFFAGYFRRSPLEGLQPSDPRKRQRATRYTSESGATSVLLHLMSSPTLS